MNTKRFFLSTLMAWLIFIGIDFLFHAGILENMWAEDVTVIKSAKDLAILIPVGYLSFLLLVLLIGYPFARIFKEKPSAKSAMGYGILVAVLFAFGNMLAVYSYIDMPLKQVILTNLVYMLEIIAVTYVYYRLMFTEKTRKLVIMCIVDFFVLVIVGVVIQNLF